MLASQIQTPNPSRGTSHLVKLNSYSSVSTVNDQSQLGRLAMISVAKGQPAVQDAFPPTASGFLQAATART